MKKLSPIFLTSGVALFSIFLWSCKSNDRSSETEVNTPEVEKTTVSVRLPIPIIEAGQTPFYVAEDKNFYADENLEVKFGMGSKELNPVKMIASGEDDFAVLGGPDGVIVARSKDQPLKAIAVLHRNSNFSCLVTLQSSGIKSVEQLQGKKVGFFYGHISTDILRNLFRRNNIKPSEVDVGFDYNQLLTGNIAAQWAFTVTAGLELPAKGVKIDFIHPSDYGIVTHGYTIFANEEMIRNKPDLVLRFLRATLKGVEYTVENPADAIESLFKRDPSLDRELNKKRLELYNAVTSHGEKYPSGYMDLEMFEGTYKRLLEENIVQNKFDLLTVFTTEFLDKIHGADKTEASAQK